MNKVVICPRCNRKNLPGMVICECGEMLGGIKLTIDDEIENEGKISVKERREQPPKEMGNNRTSTTQVPMLSVIFYVLSILSFVGGIIMANDKSLAFISPVYWAVAGFINSTIFLFMGRVIYYLNGIYRK